METIVPVATTPVDVSARVGVHPYHEHLKRQRENRLGHICRECRNPDCVGEQRDTHERRFASAEESSLLSTVEYFACPNCHADERTAPSCRGVNDDDLRELKPPVSRPHFGFSVGAGAGRRAA